MADHQSVLRHTSPGWAALLPGFIPALLFVAVHGTRRSYELLQTIVWSSQESTVLILSALDVHQSQVLLAIAAALLAGSLLIWAIRHVRRRSRHRALSGAD